MYFITSWLSSTKKFRKTLDKGLFSLYICRWNFGVLEARYPNNPTLSDEVAQCGVAATHAQSACWKHATKTNENQIINL